MRRRILDKCKIVEILLTDTKHFEGVSFAFAGMAITTLERCSDAEARRSHTMRLVDYIREPADFAAPGARLTELRQEEYEAPPETPFFVGVPRDVLEAAQRSERVRDVARGRQGLITADDKRFLASLDDPRVTSAGIAASVSEQERREGIAPSKPYWIPFAKGEGFGEFWKPPTVVIDWSRDSVAELARRDELPPRPSRKPRFQNREYYFRPGITYSVVSSGRLSFRRMPDGWIFSDKGSAIFVEDESQSESFLLGYLNSALATYFMKRLVNTTATAHLGYVEKLPYRRPDAATEAAVVERVDRIVAALQADPSADVASERAAIDEAIFDLYELRPASRQLVLSFYGSVGRVQQPDQAASE